MTTIFTKAHITLGVAILIAIGNAITPFLSSATAGTLTTLLVALGIIFNVSETNKAIAAAKAPSSQQ